MPQTGVFNSRGNINSVKCLNSLIPECLLVCEDVNHCKVKSAKLAWDVYTELNSDHDSTGRPMLWVKESQRRPKRGLSLLVLEFWKSWRGQTMSQTSALNLAGSKKVKMGLYSIGTSILEVCDRSECVADQFFESGMVQGGKNGA